MKTKEKKYPTPNCDIIFKEIQTNLDKAIEELIFLGLSEEEILKKEKKMKHTRAFGKLLRKIGLGK